MSHNLVWKLLLLLLVLIQDVFATAADNGTWTPFGGVGEGCTGTIWAAATAANGDLYVGGYFAACGDAPAANVARWDGQHWYALGSGINGVVYAIAVSGNDVYVTGTFGEAGGVAASGIAHWNGTAWSALGSGIVLSSGYEQGHAVAVIGDDVYVSGGFDSAGGVPVTNIARWSNLSQSWSALGTQPPNGVVAMAVSGTTLIVGGTFNSAGAASNVGNIAAWDGSTWSALGSGVSGGSSTTWGVINSLVVSGTTLYAGGTFTTAGAIPAARVASWNGSTWSALGSGVNKDILAMALTPVGLYVGGKFTTAGGNPVGYVALWNGSAWSNAGGGVARDNSSLVVRAMAASGSTVYAGGAFACAGGCAVKTHFVAAWDGGTWSALGTAGGSGLHSEVTAVVAYAGGTCAGTFWEGYAGLGKLACWDGNAWGGLGGNQANDIPQYVQAMTTVGSNIYVGGFLSVGTGCCIGRWDGAVWSALGGGVDDEVDSIAISGGDVYVGGFFANAGGQPASGVAQWDGISWHALGTGVVNGLPDALAVYQGQLYAGGSFQIAGGNPIPYLAMWDGATWSPVGGGVDGQVNALLVVGNQLYVGGYFINAGGSVVNGIASWDGNAWSAISTVEGTGVTYNGSAGSVSSLASSGSTLYVGGAFDHAGGTPASNIARWDGKTFTSFGSGSAEGVGSYGNVLSLAVNGADVYVGGHFGTAGGQLSASIARYTPDQIFTAGSFE